MKSTKMRVARFLPLIALLALAPFGSVSCTDAGDEPGGPTGPVTVYDPGRDYTGATVVVEASDGSIQAGQTFTITAQYRDAFGAAVTGAPLTIGTEAAYFSTPADPSYTNGEGRVSFQVAADTDCPSGTYEFAVYTFPATPMYGPSVYGYVTVRVGGGGVSTVTLQAVATSVAQGTPASFIATADLTSDCTPVFYYQAGGAGANTTTWTQTNGGNDNPNFFTVPTSGSFTGPMTVVVRVYCQGTSSAYAESGTVTVSVGTAAAITITQPTVTGDVALVMGQADTYSASGSTCSNGESVDYQFAASGSPTQTSPTAWGAGSATFTWNVVGTYTVTAQARCVTSLVQSGQSTAVNVTVN